GGERITLPGRRHSHALKHVLQERAVPPWERAQLPLLSDADGAVLAAGDRTGSAALATWLEARRARPAWTPPRPSGAEPAPRRDRIAPWPRTTPSAPPSPISSAPSTRSRSWSRRWSTAT